MRKVPLLNTEYDGFHFIGHLQSNKINQLLSLKPFLIHSIDSVYLAQKLHLALGRSNRIQDILIQINSSEEDSKSGLSFADVEEAIIKITKYSTLFIRGLMTIGKLDEPEASLDRPAVESFLKLLNILHESGRTIITISHDLNILSEYCSFLVCLNRHLHCHNHTELVDAKMIHKTFGESMHLIEKGY